jgi:uncharacterized protein YkwD
MYRTPRRLRRVLLCIALFASLAAGSVVAAPASSAAVPTQSHADIIGDQVLRLLNSERALYRLAPVRPNSSLKRAARAHNIAMANRNSMSHQLPGELSLGTRISSTGYHWRAAGENLGFNTDWSLGGALLLQRMMFGEKPPNDGHRRNILNATYRDVGLDVYVDARHHKIWLTEEFGRASGT